MWSFRLARNVGKAAVDWLAVSKRLPNAWRGDFKVLQTAYGDAQLK
jgi:hypothetical protein